MNLLDLDARWRRFNDANRACPCCGQTFSGIFDIGFDHPDCWPHGALRDSHCQGYPFTSGSDCETLLALWTRHGTEALTQLRGMYAAALYDPAAGEAVLLRDPFGIKPLYVSETDDGIFFASELAVLRVAGISRTAPEAFHAGCIIDRQFAPDDMPGFADIRRLAPGEMLVIRDGRIVERRRDTPLDASRDRTGDLAGGDASIFQKELQDSVEAHLMADVPLGLFFSGGVDSSAILASLADLRSRDGHAEPILTYTARFDGGGEDGTELAASLATAEGAEFVDVPYGKSDFMADLGRAALACDDAVADYAFALLLTLARRTHSVHQTMREGGWKTEWGVDMRGKTLGIIGCGRIGRAVAKRASGFDMKCLAYDVQPHPDAQAMGVEFVDLETLLQKSDFVTIHAALTDANQGMMGEAELKQMKPTALPLSAVGYSSEVYR